MAKKVVLAGACRTAIGKMGGALSNTPAADLGAIVIKEALNRAGVKPEMVDEVKMGCVIQAAQGQNEKGLAVYRNLRKRGFSKEDALVIADISPDLVVDED